MRLGILALRCGVLALTLWALLTRTSCFYLENSCRAINVLSYFTIHSHIIMIAVLMAAIILGALGKTEPAWLTTARLLATTYVVISGAVFGLLILDGSRSQFLLLAPPSSMVLHFGLPFYALADFFAFTRRRLPLKLAWTSLAFPVAWAVYTLIRGRAANWYPYFFLNPDRAGGYGMIGLYALGLAAVILGLAALLILVSNSLARTRMRDAATSPADRSNAVVVRPRDRAGEKLRH